MLRTWLSRNVMYIVYVDNWLVTGSAIKEHFDHVATSCSGKCLKVELIEVCLKVEYLGHIINKFGLRAEDEGHTRNPYTKEFKIIIYYYSFHGLRCIDCLFCIHC